MDSRLDVAPPQPEQLWAIVCGDFRLNPNLLFRERNDAIIHAQDLQRLGFIDGPFSVWSVTLQARKDK